MTITVDEFKQYFNRDFPFLPIYDDVELYNSGDKVYKDDQKLFYTCNIDGTTGDPPSLTTTVTWTKVPDDVYEYVLDEDVQRAISEALASVPIQLFSDDVLRLAYLYCTAHYLTQDIRTAQKGLSSTGEFAVSSKSAGNVSESYAIPAKFLQSEIFSYFTKSGYGLKYLSLLIPRTKGNIQIAYGATQP